MCNCVIKILRSFFHRGKGARAFPSWNRCKGKDDL